MPKTVLLSICMMFIAVSDVGALESTVLHVEAVVESSPTPRITLSWDSQASGTVYDIVISRRLLGEEEPSTWGAPIDTVSYPTTSYIDSSIVVGIAYEYKLHRTHGNVTSYVASGIEVPLEEERGKIILVVDSTIAAPLASELTRFELDLVGDGWIVIRQDSARDGAGTAEDLKTWIVAKYNEDPENTAMLLLFGHLPIVMSGYSKPDGHDRVPHATDLFYGDMNGTWTDSGMNIKGINIPGDGIYDQNFIPDNLMELQVGRIDMAKMDTWSENEVELLRNYLRKNYFWRHALIADSGKAIFGNENTHLPMEHGVLHSLYPTDDVVIVNDWVPEASINSYTWGAEFGDWNGSNYPSYDFKMTFTINFGSNKQKWERTNNPMRAILAMPDFGLTCVWGARPFWFFHHMGMGEPIGYSAYRTQNNFDSDYTKTGPFSFKGGVHLNLMGDPTLRMYPLAAPTQLFVNNTNGNNTLTWTASTDQVLGYYVYRASDAKEPFTRLSATLITSTSYTDKRTPAGTSHYMVRAIRLEDVTTGSYYNSSQGVFASGGSATGETVTVNFNDLSDGEKGTSVTVGDYIFEGFNLNGIPDQIEVLTSGFASPVIRPNNWGGRITVRRVDGGLFNLEEFQHGKANPWGGGLDVIVTGHFPLASDTITSPLNYNGMNPLATKILSNWSGLESLTFEWNGGMNSRYGVLDNIKLSTGNLTPPIPTMVNFNNFIVGEIGTSLTVGDYIFEAFNSLGTPDQIEVLTNRFASPVVRPNNWGGRITVRRMDGGLFNLEEFQHGKASPWGGDQDLIVTGHYPLATNESTAPLNYNGMIPLATKILSNWSGLQSLTFDWNGGENNRYGVLDNIKLSADGGIPLTNFNYGGF